MAIFKSFKTLVKNPNNKFRSFLSFCASATPFPSSSPPLSSTFHHSSPSSPSSSSSSSIFPFSYYKCVPFTGPLFLSSPPWQLSQSATPLYLHCELVLRKAESFNSRLIQRRFPIKPGFGSGTSSVEMLGNGVVDDEKEDGGRVSDRYESFFNLPNLISLSRLVSGPFIGWMIVNEWYLSSFMVLAVSGATDWLDGYMARKMSVNSVIGSYLDPLADKVLIGCVALAMVDKDLLPSWLVGLVLFRDVGLISGAVYKRASDLNWQWKNWSDFMNLNCTRPQKVEPLFISKVNTVFQLALVAAALLQPELGTEETQQYITYMGWLVASTMAASTIAYGVQHMQGGAISAASASISRTKSV